MRPVRTWFAAVIGLGALALATVLPAVAAPETAPAPAQAQAAGSSTSPALTGLADCVRQRGRLDALLLIDESGSLKDTDPLNGRVDAIKTALSSLDALRGSKASAAPPEITVQVAGFGVQYEQVTGWQRFDAKAGSALQREADAFASRNTSRDTDYFAALDGARQSFATRPDGGDGPACRLLLWFTDGRYDIEDRLPPRADDVVTKYYAPDLRLDAPGGGRQMIDRGRGLLCANGGVVDQLRDSGVVTLPVVLTTSISPEDQAFLDAIASGGCGQRGSPATGTTFRAADLAAAVLSFDQIANSTQASTPLGAQQTVVCQQRRCPDGIREFTIDPIVRRFRVVVITGTVTGTVELGIAGPDETVRVKSGANGSREIGGATVRYRWVGSSTLVLDCELGAGSDRERQRWNLVVSDPEAAADTIASSEVTVFTDLTATLAEGERFGLGDGTTFEIQLLDGDDRLTDPGRLGLEEVVVTAVVTDPTAVEPIRIELRPIGNGRFRGRYPAAGDLVPALLDVTIELAATSDSGLQLTTISRTFSVSLRAPRSYPQLSTRVLHLRPKEGTSSAVGAIRVRAPDRAGCVRVETVETATFPAQAGSVEIVTVPAPATTGCTRIERGGALTIDLRATPMTAVNGSGQGSVRLVLSNTDEERPITVLVPLDYRLAQSANLACIDDGVIVASPSGIDVIRDCTPQSVLSGVPVLVAIDDGKGGIIFQRDAGTIDNGLTAGGFPAGPIERITPRGRIEPILSPPSDGNGVQLAAVAVPGEAPTIVYRSAGPVRDEMMDITLTAQSLDGSDTTTLFSGGCVPGNCASAFDPSFGGGRYAMVVLAEFYSWIEFRDAAGQTIELATNPFATQGPGPESEQLISAALSPDGTGLATVEYASSDSFDDRVLVVTNLDTGDEVSRYTLPSSLGGIRRLEFDGQRALISVARAQPSDNFDYAQNALVVDVDTGGTNFVAIPGVATLGPISERSLPRVRLPDVPENDGGETTEETDTRFAFHQQLTDLVRAQGASDPRLTQATVVPPVWGVDTAAASLTRRGRPFGYAVFEYSPIGDESTWWKYVKRFGTVAGLCSAYGSTLFADEQTCLTTVKSGKP